MITLKPRRNNHSKPKGANKRKYGTSISKRPESINQRETVGHWEADLVQGKKGRHEPVVLTLVERYSRFGISLKLADAKSDTIQKGLFELIQTKPEVFHSITFDNGTEFSQAASLEVVPGFNLKIYFCHAYSAWERGSNENFNKLLQDFIPKGISINEYSEQEVAEAAQLINQRIREVNDFQSAAETFEKMVS